MNASVALHHFNTTKQMTGFSVGAKIIGDAIH